MSNPLLGAGLDRAGCHPGPAPPCLGHPHRLQHRCRVRGALRRTRRAADGAPPPGAPARRSRSLPWSCRSRPSRCAAPRARRLSARPPAAHPTCICRTVSSPACSLGAVLRTHGHVLLMCAAVTDLLCRAVVARSEIKCLCLRYQPGWKGAVRTQAAVQLSRRDGRSPWLREPHPPAGRQPGERGDGRCRAARIAPATDR